MTKAELAEQIPMIPPYRVISSVSILAETKDYNHEMMNIPAMWKNTKGGGVKVVVLDSGVPNHVDLQVQGGESFVPGYSEDKNGHATHVGGIIAAIANNGMGVAGISPDCEDYYGAVLGASGSGSFQGIVDGIRWAVDEVGAQVINMSLGIAAGYPISTELEEACNYARNQGVAVICAAGNEAGGVGQPACYDSTIAVAAVNSRMEHARFSNTGSEVTLAAGGVDVYSTYLNNGYAKLSGTSMASPALTGVATRILADEYKDHQKWLSPDELVDKMKKIAFDVGEDGFDEIYGHGIPVFSNESGPSDPEQPEEPKPEKPKDDKRSPCTLGLPMAKAFSDAAVKGLDSGESVDQAVGDGLRALAKFLGRLEAQAKR